MHSLICLSTDLSSSLFLAFLTFAMSSSSQSGNSVIGSTNFRGALVRIKGIFDEVYVENFLRICQLILTENIVHHI